ncbi:hypothetical protein [Streptomyces avermitilis]|uniref:hypothetical protein n=1 Tax=Streptomyces avermitilis TaxID=33903 RepID=UPI0033A8DF94
MEHLFRFVTDELGALGVEQAGTVIVGQAVERPGARPAGRPAGRSGGAGISGAVAG